MALRPLQHHRRHRSVPFATISWFALPIAVATGLCVYELSRPNALIGVVGVDDGVYFGAAVRLIHGVLPYRDFVLLHPPGIALAMSPVALASRLIGTRDALAIARVLTAIVAVVNVGLVAHLLRGRGRLIAGISALALSLYPLSVAATNTLTLEPYFVLFCLSGAAIAFGSGGRGDPFYCTAGALFAVAADIKLWAILPAISAVIVVGFRNRRAAVRLTAGFISTFAVLNVVFVAASPGAFFHDVFATQFTRATSAGSATTLTARLFELTGVSAFTAEGGTPRDGLVVAAITAALVIVALFRGYRRIDRFDLFTIATWVLLVVAVLSTSEFYEYYGYAPAVFEALALGSALALFRSGRATRSTPSNRRYLLVGLPVAAGALLLLQRDVGFVGEFLAGSDPFDPAAAIDARIPAGACVLTDQMSLLIDVNRVTPSGPGCPAVVDPYGTWLAADASHPPPSSGPYNAALVGTWGAWLHRAQFTLFEFPIPNSRNIPDAPSILSTFSSQYLTIYSSFGANVSLNAGGTSTSR